MKTKQLKKTKTPKQLKEEGKPKRSLNVYNLFFAIERQKIKNEQGNVGFGNLARIVSERWKTIDPVYKQELEDLARLDRIRFDNEMQLWRAKKEEEERDGPSELGENPEVSIPSAVNAFRSFSAIMPCKPIAEDSSASFCGNFLLSHPVSASADLNEAKAFFQSLNPTPPDSVPQSDASKPSSVPGIQQSIFVDHEVAELRRHYGLDMTAKPRRRHRPLHSLDDFTFVYETEEDQHQPVSYDTFPSAAAPLSPTDSGFHFSDMNAMALMSSQYQGAALVSPTQGHMASSMPHEFWYQGLNREMMPLQYAPAMGNARDHSETVKPSSEDIGHFISSILSL